MSAQQDYHHAWDNRYRLGALGAQDVEMLCVKADKLERVLEADIEALCEVMHDAYEQAAIGAGWETQTASRKPWADVPEANKATMRVAVAALLAHLRVKS